MVKYKLLIAYDGTNYSGWQVQPTGVSIQELLQNAIKTVIREEVVVIGSGRTDAGVHATGQVAHFKCQGVLDLCRFVRSVNALLPIEIRVLHIEEVSQDFHARYSAISKTYHYHLNIGKAASPFNRIYSWHIYEKLDVCLLKAAAALFVGKHDFTSFANQADRGSAGHNAVRTMLMLNVVEDGDNVCLEFKADGFLYKMVRNITGTLVEVATNKRSIEEISKLLRIKDRRQAGMAAPPQGLFLVSVDY